MEQLIKSKLISVHRRVLVGFLSTVLRLKAKTVPTVQKYIGYPLGTKYPIGKPQH